MTQTYHEAIESLNEIYSLENVDLKSVKTLQENSIEATWKNPEPQLEGDQLLFDFGPPFKNSIRSLVLLEPIETISLSSQALQALKKQGKTKLADLCQKIEGLGLGHQEELSQKLDQYLKNERLYNTRKLSLKSLVLSIAAGVERKALFECLQDYKIESLLKISKEELLSKTSEKAEIATKENRSFLKKTFEEIGRHLLIPWMQKRSNLASKEEILQWLSLVDPSPEAKNTINFLQDIFFESDFLFKTCLIEVERDVYCINEENEKKYRIALRVLKSYFYKRGLSYRLIDLCLWIQREAAREWFEIEQPFLERCIFLSGEFQIRKIQSPQVLRL